MHSQVISIRKILSRTWSNSGNLTLVIKSSTESLHQVKRVSLNVKSKARCETLSPADVSEMADWWQITTVSQSVSENGNLCFKEMVCVSGQWKGSLHQPKRRFALLLLVAYELYSKNGNYCCS